MSIRYFFSKLLSPDKTPDFDISAHLAKTTDNGYVGFIVINTDEYNTAKEAIDDIVWLAETHELGFDASDIDLSGVLNGTADDA